MENGKIKYFKVFFVFNLVAYYIFSFIYGNVDFRLWGEEYRTYYVLYGIILGALISTFYYIDDNWNPGG